MAPPTGTDVLVQYNHTEHASATSLTDSAWTEIVAAGPHKMITVQNVATGALAVLRVLTAGPAGTPGSELGFLLPAPGSTLTSHLSIFTAGEAVFAKSNASANKADYQVVVYY